MYLWGLINTTMKHIYKLIAAIFATMMTLAVVSCDTEVDHRYDSGVSLELAQWRKQTIKELSYNLHFDIPEQRETAVTGRVEIAFRLDAPEEVVIDFRDTDLISKVMCNGSSAIEYQLANEHIIIDSSALCAGHNSVVVAFEASSQSLNRNDEFLYTLLVPDRARTLFPSFDQPDLKASFSLSLTIPREWVAVSNTAVEHCESIDDHRQSVHFAPTEPLSTYLFSFVAGRLNSRTYDDGEHRFTAYYRESDPKRLAQLDKIFAEVKAALVWLEEYTQIEYPFAKYDFVMLPGFQYGGMEHTGATLYNDRQMFLGENPTLDEELRRTQLIAHETAHMWFGDYVTMRWFDDVWTKEIFANYFAARMAEPLYPTIDHRLNRLKSYTTAALSEDRTAGATSIRQELDNLQNAGLIYGQTIYNKAPIVMDKMVEIMGEEAFREGIREYLATYAYGNATWPELIAILDNYTDEDLAEFSNVWVHSKGMPRIETSFDGGVLSVVQYDTLDRGLVWRQSFSCRAITAEGTFCDVEVTMTDGRHSYAIPENTIAVVPNIDGRGYGLFLPDAGSLEWMMSNISTLTEEVARLAAAITLNECYEWGYIDARKWLDVLLETLPREKSYLVASTLNGYLAKPMIEQGSEADELQLWNMAQCHPISSLHRGLVMTLARVVKTDAVVEKLYRVWSDQSIEQLGESDAMTLALELAIRLPDRSEAIVAAQRERLTSDDRRRQFDYTSQAAVADIAARDALFEWLLEPENRRTEPWAATALALLNHHTRQTEAVKYIYRGLEELVEVQRTGDIFFPRNWAGALLAGHHSDEARGEVMRFLEDNNDYNPLLRNKILQAANIK